MQSKCNRKEHRHVKSKRVLCILLALVCLLGALWVCGRVLQPKYLTSSLEGSMAAAYYNDVAEVTHDVLFIGDCEVFSSYIPAVLWEKYGISSSIRGSAQQLVWHAYYLLKDALRYETPQVVVFNVQALKYGEPQKEAYNRMALDGMAWSTVKAEAIRASATQEDTFLSYVFPLLRYHSRWTELTAEDFRYAFGPKPAVTHGGYLLQTGIAPSKGDDQSLHAALTDPQLPETAMTWLDRLADLCQEKGVRLVLVKAPTNHWKYWWYDEWDQQIAAYAEGRGLTYVNMIPLQQEIGLDWRTDTYDEGAHLNVYGAEKLTAWFGRMLSEEMALPDRRVDHAYASVWTARLDAFHRAKAEQEMESAEEQPSKDTT